MSIEKFFDAAVKFKASDLFISAGKAPSFRVSGVISKAENIPPLENADINAFRLGVIGEEGERIYQQTGGADSSFLHNGNRFRISSRLFFEQIFFMYARSFENKSSCDHG